MEKLFALFMMLCVAQSTVITVAQEEDSCSAFVQALRACAYRTCMLRCDEMVQEVCSNQIIGGSYRDCCSNEHELLKQCREKQAEDYNNNRKQKFVNEKCGVQLKLYSECMAKVLDFDSGLISIGMCDDLRELLECCTTQAQREFKKQ